jgi:hypothetical protein
MVRMRPPMQPRSKAGKKALAQTHTANSVGNASVQAQGAWAHTDDRACGVSVVNGVTSMTVCARTCTVGDGTRTSDRNRRANKANKTVFAGGTKENKRSCCQRAGTRAVVLDINGEQQLNRVEG